ncbi:MAG TPA: hypothetical protein VIU61_02660, partial [Kofleriaceae bacterium]
TPTPVASTKYDQISRIDFNRWANRQNIGLYWIVDADKDGTLDPDELATLMFFPPAPDLAKAYPEIVAAAKAGPSADPRQKLVGEDLDGGRPTLVRNDLTKLSADDKKFVQHMLKVGELIDRFYEIQLGITDLAANLPGDPASQRLFRRNWGPKCIAPATQNNKECSAIPGSPKPIYGIYPAELQADDKFCAALEKRPDAKTLMAPFVAVRGTADKLTAVPFTEAFAEPMGAIAKELNLAADAMKDPEEKPLVEYLRAAAKAFTTNDWVSADEPWSRMSSGNSKWYVRVGPDETYWEPCAQKAGAHLTFARIDQNAKEWQAKLAPVKQEMETAIAAKAGAPYKARTVQFTLPDFIEIVINAGDDRDPLGATIGQSLPNWGKVSDDNRDRTMVMSNLYTDPDSMAARRAQAESLFDAESMKTYSGEPTPGNLSTILHELTHNLGPYEGYKVNGKKPAEAFGGPTSSMMEELKAQTGALFLIELLRGKKVIDDKLAAQTYIDSIVWAFGHISQGMKDGDGNRKAYSNLAAIQVGFLIEKGVLVWDAKKPAANGKDTGAFTLDSTKLVAAVDEMMKLVGGIKARGDKAAAEQLITKYSDGTVVPHATIQERFLRFPKPSFVYSLSL